MKKTIFILSVLLSFMLLHTSYGFFVGDLEYSNNGDGTATVIGTSGAATVITVPTTVNDGGQVLTIVKLGEDALRNKGITSITLPDSITYIDTGALAQNDLTAIDLPDNLEEIGDGAFVLNDITGVFTIPSNVKRIGNTVFWRNAIDELRLPRDIEHIGNWAFPFNDIEILTIYPAASAANPIALKRIEHHTFQSDPNEGFEPTLDVPEGVEFIGSYGFGGQTEVTTVNLPNSLKKMDVDAFRGSFLPSINLPSSPTAYSGHTPIWKDTSGGTYNPGDPFVLADYDLGYDLYYPLDGSVSISGTAMFNEVLTAVPAITYTGSLNYQWYRGNSSISDATNSTYQLVESDVGKLIKVAISSSVENSKIESAQTASVVKAPAPVPLNKAILPVVSINGGDFIELSTVSGYEYTILTDGGSVAGATWSDSPTLSGLTEDTDYDIYQRFKETNGYFQSLESDPLDIKTAIILTGTASVSGIPIVDEMLSINESTNNTGNLSYQWMRNGSVISGETNSTYQVMIADIGQALSYILSSDIEYGTVTSTSTSLVTKKTSSVTPLSPQLSSRTTSNITLMNQAGYEYSIENGSWTSNNVFSGLSSGTSYDFRQRIAETADTFASVSSSNMSFSTSSPSSGSSGGSGGSSSSGRSSSSVVQNSIPSSTKTVSYSTGFAKINNMKYELGTKLHVFENRVDTTIYRLNQKKLEKLVADLGYNNDFYFIFDSPSDAYQMDYYSDNIMTLIESNQTLKMMTEDLIITMNMENLDFSTLADTNVDTNHLKMYTVIDKLDKRACDKLLERLSVDGDVVTDLSHTQVLYEVNNEEGMIHEISDVFDNEIVIQTIDPSQDLRLMFVDTNDIVHYLPYTIEGPDGNQILHFQTNGFGIFGLVHVENMDEILSDHWARETVNDYYKKGIINESVENKINADITRGDFMALLAKSTGVLPTATNYFNDVTYLDPNAGYINVMKKLDLVNGTGEGKFNPTGTVTRQDMMTMIYRFIKEHEAIRENHGISDKVINDNGLADSELAAPYAKEAVNWFTQNELIYGDENGSLRLFDSATTAEALILLDRALSMGVE